MRSADDAHRPHRGRLVGVGGRNHQLVHAGGAGKRRGDRERPSHRRQGSVERKLTDEHTAGDLFRAQKLRSVKNAQCDREIEARAFLLHIGGREVDRDVARRKPEAAVVKRGANTRIRFAHRRVGKSYQSEAGLRRLRCVDLDGDAYRVNSVSRGAPYFREHGTWRPRGSP